MDALEYARQLIEFESPSHLSNVPVSDYVQRELEQLGFETERVDYTDRLGVSKSNVVAKKGPGTGGLAYFGHTDVVPADDWARDHGPFEPAVSNGRLYGRGACDMKGSVACMLAAAAATRSDALRNPVYVTCTADEEIGYGGAESVVARSALYKEMQAGETHAVIGEPTLLNVVYAHKGTYGFRATARGRAAHSSTSNGVNANLAMIPFLVEMKAIHDDTKDDAAWQNQEFDPPSISWNIGINDHNRALNITAPQSVCTVYFRPMPGQDPQVLLDRSARKAEQCGIEFEVLNRAQPLYVDPSSDYVRDVMRIAGNDTARTVCYGTDGGVFRDLTNILVLGPGDIAQAHTADEWISLEQLEQGTSLYVELIRRYCC